MKKQWILIITGVVLVAILIFIVSLIWQNKFSNSLDQSAQSQINQKMKNSSSTQTNKRSSDTVSTLTFDNKEQTFASNEKFTLKAMLDTRGKKISAAELHIVFDPKILKLESIDSSDIFSLVLSGAKIDNEKGAASIVVGVPLGKKAAEDVVSVAIFNFQTISAGHSEVNFSDKSVAAAEGSAGNVINSRAGALINVQ